MCVMFATEQNGGFRQCGQLTGSVQRGYTVHTLYVCTVRTYVRMYHLFCMYCVYHLYCMYVLYVHMYVCIFFLIMCTVCMYAYVCTVCTYASAF